MKINMIKQRGGILIPASDADEEKLTKFHTGEIYPVELKGSRNPAFHSKMFVFFNFCFQYWKCDREFLSETKQLEVFRKNLTVLAGFYDEFWTIKGTLRIEAKSLAYSNMGPDEFEECYKAMINAAITHIFGDADYDIQNRLMRFF